MPIERSLIAPDPVCILLQLASQKGISPTTHYKSISTSRLTDYKSTVTLKKWGWGYQMVILQNVLKREHFVRIPITQNCFISVSSHHFYHQMYLPVICQHIVFPTSQPKMKHKQNPQFLETCPCTMGKIICKGICWAIAGMTISYILCTESLQTENNLRFLYRVQIL